MQELKNAFIFPGQGSQYIGMASDLYNSTKLVLEFITDLVQDGTILIFDDWFAYICDVLKDF